ncbi:MAG TPA: ABC transporter permease [Pyrinomonadaceae bacterium]|nr:ABC transporter permease [Pyrinomonadaceae bacterium]
MRLLGLLASKRFWPLFMKELRQIKRNRKLVVMLIMPPTVNLILLGFAMNSEVKNVQLGVVDESRTAASRELVSAFVESGAFQIAGRFESSEALGRALSAGQLDAGLVVPQDFARLRARGQTAEVQIIVDSVNSNRAGIAGGYAARIVAALNTKLTAAGGAPFNVSTREAGAGRAGAEPRVAVLYNPGLRTSWFIVTGTIGILMVLIGSLVASASMVNEKESGTIEQLLMTPAGSTEIIAAKVAPIMLLLSADIMVAVIVVRLVFGVPLRGSLTLLYFAGMLCVLAGIGIGTFIATFTRSQTQAQLMSFFVNPPVSMLSGATTPIEGMPQWLQQVSYVNPVRHFSTIARGVLLKGVGLDVLYPNLLALAAFAFIIVGASVWRFRKQLS